MFDVLEIDAATGQITERNFTNEEMAQIEADKKANAQAEKERKAAEARRQAAIAKLTALGLDVEDLQALGITS